MIKNKKNRILNRLLAATLCLVIILSQLPDKWPLGGEFVARAAETGSSPITLTRLSGSGEAFIYHSFNETTEFASGKTYAFLDDIYSSSDAVSALGAGAILKATDEENNSLKYIRYRHGDTATVKVYVEVVTPGKDFDSCKYGGLYQVPSTSNPTAYRYFCYKGGAKNCGPYYAYTYIEESVGYTDVSATLNSIENQGSTNPEDYTVSITYNGNQTKTLVPDSYKVSFTAPDTVTFVISDSVGNSVTANVQSPLAIRYDGNFESAENIPSTQSVRKGNSIQISAQKPTREGYAFVNWKDSDTNKTYSAGAAVTPTSSLNLLAQWKDTQAPIIVYSPTQVMTGTTDAAVKSAVQAAVTITDNEPVSECTVTVTVPTNCAKTAGNKNVTVTVKDKAGNTATKTCSVYVSSYLDIGKPTFTASTSKLTATLNNPGTDTITASGFVWGVMNSPSLTVNNGSAKTASVVNTAGGSLSVTVSNLQKGVTYYARAYITAGSITYYSQEITIGIGTPSYGTFTIKNNGDNTFTVTRTGGSEEKQTVYYRTVNGSAVGGTHFTHKSSTLTFNAGVTSQTITITEKTANTAYSGKPATAYSNADRTYSVEIYRVVGGGSLGRTTSATRTMANDSSYKVDESEYTKEISRTVSLNDNNKWVGDHSGDGNWKIYFQNDRGKNTNGYNFNVQRTIDNAYLKETATGFLYRASFTYQEDDDGYQLVWIANHAPNSYGPATISKVSAIPLDNSVFGTAKFSATWETKDGKEATAKLPGISSGNNVSRVDAYNGDTILSNSNNWVAFERGETAHVWFSAAGANQDKWYMTSFTDYICLRDDQEPQLVAVAPMSGGTYKIGDKFVVSLIFDEIVDSTYSSLSSVSVNTSWGTATYTGGANTNVLYFTGTISENTTSTKLTVNGITNPQYIKDMCNKITNTPTASGSGTTTATLDTSIPNFTVTAKGIANGTGTASITVNSDKTKTTSMSYAWSSSTAVPATGWVTLSESELSTAKTSSGLTLSIRKAAGSGNNGKWYLHVKGVYDTTGYTNYDYATLDFGTAASPATGSTQPTLTVSASNTSWAKQRSITISATGAESLKYRKSDATSWTTLSNTATSVTVTENGFYTFLLTAGDVTITQTVEVSKIDREKPTASIEDLTSSSVESPKRGVYTKLVVPITYADLGSGVSQVYYKWTNDTTTPTSWNQLSSTATSITYTPTESAPTAKYLHIKVVDKLNNEYTTCSSAYTVISQTAVDNSTPTITLTGAPTAWQNDMVTLTWTLASYSGKNYEVILPDGKTSTSSSGEIWVMQNGTYTVTVRDLDYGEENSASVTVDKLDFTAPAVTLSGGSSEWTKSNQTLTISASDSGSGVGEKWYKIVDNKDEIPTDGLTGFSSTIDVSSEGEYYVYYKVYDKSGDTTIDRESNKTEGFRLVKIDKTAPTINFGEYSSATGMTVTISDGTSKLKSVTYKINDGEETSVNSVSGNARIDFSVKDLSAGDNRITVTAVDNAGNTFTSYKDVHVDVVNVDIAYADMEFTYTDGIWNPETHSYEYGAWSPDKTDGDVITIENNGDVDVTVTLEYTIERSDVSASFIDESSDAVSSFALAAGEKKTVRLILTGKPSDTLSKTALGTITVTIGG